MHTTKKGQNTEITTDGNMHKASASGRRTQQVVAVIDLPCSGEQGIDGYPELRLKTEVDDLVCERKLAGLGYPDRAG